MNEPKKTLIMALPGAGKTWLCKQYKNVFDFDQTNLYLYDVMQRIIDHQTKQGRNITLRPLTAGSLICQGELWPATLTFNVVLAYPTADCEAEYVKRYRDRGSVYVEILQEYFRDGITAAQKFKAFKHQKVVLKPGQFLAEALIDNGIYLEPK